MKPYQRGFKRLWRAWHYSWQGFAACFRHEAAFRQEIALSLLILPLGFYLGDNGMERALLWLAWLLVPLAELLNSALEAIVDKASPEQHPLAKRAKDIASAAVLWSIFIFILIWSLVLI